MSNSGSGRSSTKYRSIHFSGHHAHVVGIARSLRDEKKFTDVLLRCTNGVVLAHRLVLASCSSFMSSLFLSLPEGLSEYTIIIPNMKKEIVEILVNFLYTGEMMLARSNTWELQQLVHILQIDPENVRIDFGEETSPKSLKTSPVSTKKEYSNPSPRVGFKRTASSDSSSSHSSTPSKVIVRGQARTRGRPPRSSGITRASVNLNSNEGEGYKATGFHDMMNVDTWVCAICEQFDPHIAGADKSTTEWIGCDCNRWYHQFCTKLKVLDKNFCCTLVNLECLPP